MQNDFKPDDEVRCICELNCKLTGTYTGIDNEIEGVVWVKDCTGINFRVYVDYLRPLTKLEKALK